MSQERLGRHGRPPESRVTRLVRWTLSTVILVGIALVGMRYGHTVALGLMVVFLLVVAFLGGSSRHEEP